MVILNNYKGNNGKHVGEKLRNELIELLQREENNKMFGVMSPISKKKMSKLNHFKFIVKGLWKNKQLS
jgi:hypothetical protein